METENALVQSETRFKILYDNTPTMCFVVDADGEILSVNRYGAHNLGFERSELIERSLYMTYHGEDGEEIRQCLIDVMNFPDRQHQWELRRLHKDGHVIWVRETAKRITDTREDLSILLVSVEIDAPVLEGNQCSGQ
jgi:PAS domain S-box-containing protein